MTFTRLLLILLHYVLLVDLGVGAFEATEGFSLRSTVPLMDTSQKNLTEEISVKIVNTATPKPKLKGSTTFYIVFFAINAVISCCATLYMCRCCFHCFSWVGKMMCISVSKKSREAWLEKQLLQLPPITKGASSPTVGSTAVDDIDIELDDYDDRVIDDKTEQAEV